MRRHLIAAALVAGLLAGCAPVTRHQLQNETQEMDSTRRKPAKPKVEAHEVIQSLALSALIVLVLLPLLLPQK